jgi:tetratricopeptide (TPR) repeat protein
VEAPEPLETAASSDSPKNRQVDRYLASARTALAEYRLTTPRGNNARFYLRRALDLAPDNREAQQGLDAVADTYADLVEGALDRFDYSKAKRYLGRGLSVQPDNRRLLALKSRTDVRRDAPKRLVNKVRSWF